MREKNQPNWCQLLSLCILLCFVQVHNLWCQVADVENTLLLLIMFIVIVLIRQLEWSLIALWTVQNRGGGGRTSFQIVSGQNRKAIKKNKSIKQGKSIVNVCRDLNIIFILCLGKERELGMQKKEFSNEYQVTRWQKLEGWYGEKLKLKQHGVD